MQRKSARHSSPCQGLRERLRADLGQLGASLKRVCASAVTTHRSVAMGCISVLTLWVLLGPLEVAPHELAAEVAFFLWQASTFRVINPGRGGKPC